jgi:hypothetical protein
VVLFQHAEMMLIELILVESACFDIALVDLNLEGLVFVLPDSDSQPWRCMK